jgi:hypothetical protein
MPLSSQLLTIFNGSGGSKNTDLSSMVKLSDCSTFQTNISKTMEFNSSNSNSHSESFVHESHLVTA